VSIYAIQSVVGSPEFQRAAGARITAESLSQDPTTFRLIARDPAEARAQAGFRQAQEFLKIKLRALAVSEVEASKAYVEELRGQARAWDKKEKRSDSFTKGEPDRSARALSAEDAQRVALLRQEIDGLEGFLRYAQTPDWLEAKLDRDTLRAAERRVVVDKNELFRLSEAFTPQSTAVRLQSRALQKSQRDLMNLKRHLAKALLASSRVELKGLEAKTVVAIQQNSKEIAPATDDAQPRKSRAGDSDWLAEHSRQLSDQALALEKKATLSPLTPPVTTLQQSLGYWVTMGLWLGCLSSLMTALFIGPKQEAARRNEIEHPAHTASKLRRATGALYSVPEASNYQLLAETLSKDLGRFPSCLLVLGEDGEARSTFSLQLAQGLSGLGRKVRLIDFDLRNRPLSERAGNHPFALGVSDLLAYSGPTEEFFASLPGTSIQFAPAGTLKVLKEPVSQPVLENLFQVGPGVLTLLDTSFSSPLHVIIQRVDAVLCLYRPKAQWTKPQTEVLDALRETRLPIWGVAAGDSRVFRFL
jgi:hypothetical protein